MCSIISSHTIDMCTSLNARMISRPSLARSVRCLLLLLLLLLELALVLLLSQAVQLCQLLARHYLHRSVWVVLHRYARHLLPQHAVRVRAVRRAPEAPRRRGHGTDTKAPQRAGEDVPVTRAGQGRAGH